MKHNLLSHQVTRFGVIGGVGFIVDAGIMTILNSVFSVELFHSRIISFCIAVSVTWYLNRTHTFSNRKSQCAAREWMRYVIVNGVGAALNLAIFFYLIHHVNTMSTIPVIPLAIASLLAMTFNFLMSKYLAFIGTGASQKAQG
jgi:putative flippase GtrA